MAVLYEELESEMFEQPDGTLNTILESVISDAFEDERYYYVVLKSDDPYVNSNYIINKKTKHVSWLESIIFSAVGVYDEATKITPDEFRKRVS